MIVFPEPVEVPKPRGDIHGIQPPDITFDVATSPPAPPSDEPHGAGIGAGPGASPIENLPFDILVLIVRCLDRPSIALLCQTSRTLRAWSDHLTREKERKPRSWTQLERARYRESLRKKKELCPKCNVYETPRDLTKAKKLTLNQALHCSACNKDHPLLLFSAHQRAVEAKQRVCRLQNSNLPVCSHMKIQFRDLCRWRDKNQRMRRCNHPSHIIPAYWPQVFSPAAWRQRWKERPGVHIVRPLATLHWSWTPNFDAKLHRAHDLLVLKHGELPTVPRLRAALKKLQAKGTFKLCPHLDLDDLSVTTCNPDQCACLMTESGGIYWPTGLHAQQEFGTPKCYHRWLFDDWWFPDVDRAIEDYIKAVHTENYRNPTTLVRQTKHVSFQNCCMSRTSIYCDPSNPRVIRISYEMSASEVLATKEAGPEKWDHYVDPASLGVLNDPETKHIFWCGDPSCKRYYRQPDVRQRFFEALYVQHNQPCACEIPFWAMSPSQYDLRYDPMREEKNLDHDTYYDGT